MTSDQTTADSIDTLIAQRLPSWLGNATQDQLLSLHQALNQQQAAAQEVKQLLSAIPALDKFAAPLLAAGMRKSFRVTIDVHTIRLHTVERDILPEVVISTPPPYDIYISSQPLLTTALHNFTEADTTPRLLTERTLRTAAGATLAVTFERFARLCRQMDIGGKYQALLTQHLVPTDAPDAEPGAARRRVEEVFEEALRAQLEAAIRLAKIKGEIDDRSYLALLEPVVRGHQLPQSLLTLNFRQLFLLGKCIRGVVAVEIQGRIFVWIPDDPQASVQMHSTWQALHQSLGERLRDPAYAGFFARFISERDRVSFFGALAKLNSATAPSMALELDGRNYALDEPLFAYLRRLRIEKMFDDARVLAVPTDDENTRARRERLQGYADIGLTLLNLAGLFVPVVGEIMLGVVAVQIASEVYEGYEDWQLGDRQAALGHLFGVAENVLATVALGTGASATKRLLERVVFVDGLSPILTDAGHVKLFNDDLAAYRVEHKVSAVGEYAQHPTGYQLRLHDGSYQVSGSETSETLRIRHPRRSTAYEPAIEYNNAGGWRLALARPQEWAGATDLFKRLDSSLFDLTDDQALNVLQIAGVSEETLRYLHLENAQAPARLLDAALRYRLREQFPTHRAHAFEALVATRQVEEQVADHLLRRDFPGLSVRAAQQIIQQVDSAQVELMLETKRIPLALAERARWSLHDSRLDRACAGLQLPQAVNVDTEKLALGLIDKLARWPDSERIEVRADHYAGSLQAYAGADVGEQVKCIVRGPQGYVLHDAFGQVLPGATASDSLMQALCLSLSEGQKQWLGNALLSEQDLSRILASAARSERESASQLIGQVPIGGGVRPPVRFGDGRLGYRLSGRRESRGQAARRGILQIFPTLDDTQLQRYLLDLIEQGISPWDWYGRLQHQLVSLRTVLRQWRGEPGSVLSLLRRRRVSDAIRRCWRRKGAVLADGGYALEIVGERVGSLPRLPDGVSFEHVTHLTLRDMALEDLDADFLPRFSRLVDLDLRSNRFSTVPLGVEQLVGLRRLRLGDNQIVMTEAANHRLDALINLHHLDLSFNPLGAAPDVRQLLHLRDLSMRSADITQLPARVQQLPWRGIADLRDNRLRQLNRDIHSLRVRVQHMSVHDNPLDQASEAYLSELPGPSSASSHGVRHNSSFRHQLVQQNERENWLVGSSGIRRTQREGQWLRLQEEGGSQDFFRFLRDFASSSDFERHPAYYRERVWMIIEACEQSAEIREQVFEQAGGRATCEDRLLLILSQMQVRALIHRQTAGLTLAQSEVPLMLVGRGLFRLDEVDRIAARRIEEIRSRGVDVDDIEVYLAYRVRLARELGLPGQPNRLHFEGHSGLTPADYTRARDAVLGAETSGVLAQALMGREFWQEHLRSTYRERFAALVELYREPLARYEAQAEAGEITEQAYLVHGQTLMHELEAAERALIRELTTQAYDRWPISGQ